MGFATHMMVFNTNIEDVRLVAIRLLTRREHSRYELMRKLAARGFDKGSIESALQQLCNENLQSDERFTEEYVRSRQVAGFGPFRISAELEERGVSKTTIDRKVDAHAETWKLYQQNALQKKFSEKVLRSEAPKDKQKLYQFLQARGFIICQLAT